MLSHAYLQPRVPTGFCCVGSTPVAGGRPVCTGRVASGRGAGVGCDHGRDQSLVSGVARERPAGPESRWPGRPQTASAGGGFGEARSRLAGGATRSGLCDRGVDVAAGRERDRAVDGGRPSSGSRVAGLAGIGVVPAAPGSAGARAGRGGDCPVEGDAVAATKKNARRRRAWLVFEDESGVSQHPVVRRTWAPRGVTPMLVHTGSNWKRLSVAGALAFRWDGRRTRFFFQTHAGSYTDRQLVAFLRALKRHFRPRPVVLI